MLIEGWQLPLSFMNKKTSLQYFETRCEKQHFLNWRVKKCLTNKYYLIITSFSTDDKFPAVSFTK